MKGFGETRRVVSADPDLMGGPRFTFSHFAVKLVPLAAFSHFADKFCAHGSLFPFRRQTLCPCQPFPILPSDFVPLPALSHFADTFCALASLFPFRRQTLFPCLCLCQPFPTSPSNFVPSPDCVILLYYKTVTREHTHNGIWHEKKI